MSTRSASPLKGYLKSTVYTASLLLFLKFLLPRHHVQGGVTEIRIGVGKGGYRGFFKPQDLDALVELLRPRSAGESAVGEHPRIGQAAVTFGPQPVSRALYKRGPGKFTRSEPPTDADLVAYSLFAVRIDPVRPPDVPASDEEMASARKVATSVARFFALRNVPTLVVDSGSWMELLVPTVPYADVARAARKAEALVTLLAHKFSTEGVMVKGVAPGHVCPLPGSLLVVGKATADRPHRLVQLAGSGQIPEEVDLFGLLAKEIADFKAKKAGSASKDQAGAGDEGNEDEDDGAVAEDAEDNEEGAEEEDSDDEKEDNEDDAKEATTDALGAGPHRLAPVADWDPETANRMLKSVLERSEMAFKVRKRGGDHHYLLDHCPNHDLDRNFPQCAVVVRADGTFMFRCQRDENATWQRFKKLVSWEKHARPVMRELGVAPRSLPYRLRDDGLYYVRRLGSRVVRVQLTSFAAKIVRDIEEDDGQETRHTFEIEARLNGKESRFPLTAAQFEALRWPAEHLGARAVLFPRATKAHVRAAIQLLSGDVPLDKVYTHLGWRTHEGQNVYLHASGGIGKDGVVPGVQVSLPEQLSRYHLPPPPRKGALSDAVRASLRVLDVAPDAVTIPLYAAIWGVVVGTTPFGQQVTGETGAGKTAFSALIQQHFGREMDAQHLPGNWLSTDNANERLAFLTKDAVLVVDDFVPTAGRSGGARQHQEADRLFRGQGNNAGRVRMRAGNTLESPTPPRGQIISTGEETPHGRSLRARMLVHHLARGTVDWGRMTACQQDAAAGLYASALAGYVRWLAPRLDEVRRDMPARLAELREQATASGQHKRTPGIVANLAFGLELFSQFAVEVKALPEKEAVAFRERCWKALGEAAAAQAAVQAHGEPAQRFLDLLRAAIDAGKAHVAGIDGNPPPEPAGLGWKNRKGEWVPKGERVGWLEGEDLYLEPDVSYSAAQRMAVERHEPLGVGPKALHKRLHEQGHLVSTDQARGRLNTRKTLEGEVRVVLHLRAEALPRPAASADMAPENLAEASGRKGKK